MKNPVVRFILLCFITLFVPFALVIGAVRIVLNQWYPSFEYRTPWFPADLYGFSRAERDQYARIAIDYLNSGRDISLLLDLRFPPGQTAPPFSCLEMDDCNRLYNDREIQHMIDVKYVLGIIMPVGYGVIGALLLFGIWAWKGKWLKDYLTALQRGGWLMIAILLSLVLLVVSVFDWFFTKFHNVFFSSGTWQFYTSDTLIRLFPERFWMDTFIVVGGIAAVGGLLFIFIGSKLNS